MSTLLPGLAFIFSLSVQSVVRSLARPPVIPPLARWEVAVTPSLQTRLRDLQEELELPLEEELEAGPA